MTDAADSTSARTTSGSDTEWELEARPRKSARWAAGIAAVIFLVHATLAVLLRSANTGVYFQVVDQFAMIGIGAAMAGGVLLLARPRVRANADGVEVRNLINQRLVPWHEVQGLTFTPNSSWARIELPFDEYLPVMAIQANDREYAVHAARTFRALEQKYT